MTFKVTEENGTLTGVMDGRLDTAAAPQFAEDLKIMMDNADKHLVLDMEQLSFISSSGLRLLLSLRKETMAKNGDITIINVLPEVKQVFTITGFYSLFQFK